MVKEIARTTPDVWERLDRALIEAVDYGYNWDNANDGEIGTTIFNMNNNN